MRGLALWVLPVLALALVAAGCGGGGSDTNKSSTSSAGQGQTETKGGKQGGRLPVLSPRDVDYLDPGHTYDTTGYGDAYPRQRPLYSFKPESNDPVPDLADGP